MRLQEDKTRFINNLPWESEEEKSKVLDFFKTHANLESKIQNWQSKDKENLVNEIRDLISKVEKASLEKEKTKEGYRGNIDWESHGCRYLGEDEDWIYITPLSWEGAKFCDSAECGGAGAKWCIGYEKSDEYWNHYRKRNALFLMKFNKYPEDKQEDLKFMIEGYLKEDMVNIWNQQDHEKRHTLSKSEKGYLKAIQKIWDDVRWELVSKYFDNPEPGVYIAKNEEALQHIKDIKKDLKVFKVKEGSTFKNVKDASDMFRGCTSLTSIDTSAFKNVKNAYEMFYGCTSLTSIDTSGFKKVENATGMFYDCTSLTSIDTTALGNVKYTSCMFKDCASLTSIDASAFVNVRNAYGMFEGCSSLTSIDTSTFVNVKTAYGMFRGCTSLTSIDTSGFVNVQDAYGMFEGCSSLTSIDTSTFKNVKNAPYMFSGCKSLTSIDTSGFVNVKNTSFMFCGCTSLASVDTSGFVSAEDARRMFGGCISLTSIDTSAFGNIKTAYGMFEGCSSLTSIDTSAFRNVKGVYSMFEGCASLTSIDTSAFVNVKTAYHMFDGCTSLKTYIPGPSNRVNKELKELGAKPVGTLGESLRRRMIEEILEE